MQIKIFTIPIIGGEWVNEEMNAFLRSKKILTTETEMVKNERGAFWCFCIKYIDGGLRPRQRVKVDYKEVLDKSSFARFSKMREIRKRVAQEDQIPAYAVFTDEELAGLAKIEGDLTTAGMLSVKGIGSKKVEKYAQYFIKKAADEKS